MRRCVVEECEDNPEHPFCFITEGTDGTRYTAEGMFCQFHAQTAIHIFKCSREAPISTVSRQAAKKFTQEFEDPNTNGVVTRIDKKRL